MCSLGVGDGVGIDRDSAGPGMRDMGGLGPLDLRLFGGRGGGMWCSLRHGRVGHINPLFPHIINISCSGTNVMGLMGYPGVGWPISHRLSLIPWFLGRWVGGGGGGSGGSGPL
jgi:hypothetical protein